ncbi:MAG: BsuPI-related putative proteinase inhibitor [Actinobacteria bacterium]|nr:BsuPI-related putative proteinase inhibitor [Actinomycetota bacterium]
MNFAHYNKNQLSVGGLRNIIYSLLIFVISFILMLSCTLSRIGVPQKTGEKQSPAKVVDEVEFTLIVDPVKTSTGPVILELRIENRSAEVRKLTFSTAQKYDFWVLDPSGEEVWRWSHDKSFLQIVEELQIPAGAKLAFIESFDVIDMSSGRYTAYGEILAYPTSISLSDQFEIKK